MDAFYASVEIRDDPSLKGRPLIIGSLPTERGVVATASYEARKYGVHSAMNIKEAYRLCPGGVFMHPNFDKYKRVSGQLHGIWDAYASASEAIALDEAYLDVGRNAGDFEGARRIARLIKERTFTELGLTCSVGLAYSKTAAKMASEEKKPDGYFEIPTPEDFVRLVRDRDVRVLYTVGEKTAEKLRSAGFQKVRDIQERPEEVIRLLGKHGIWLAQIAAGQDERKVVPYRPEDAKSLSREITFQEDVSDFALLKDVLFLIALNVEHRAKRVGLHGKGVCLKITYGDMKKISRSKSGLHAEKAEVIWQESVKLLDQVRIRPVRLIGAGLIGLEDDRERQLRLEDLFGDVFEGQNGLNREEMLEDLGKRYGLNFKGNLDKLNQSAVLHRTAEYMRKARLKKMRGAGGGL